MICVSHSCWQLMNVCLEATPTCFQPLIKSNTLITMKCGVKLNDISVPLAIGLCYIDVSLSSF